MSKSNSGGGAGVGIGNGRPSQAAPAPTAAAPGPAGDAYEAFFNQSGATAMTKTEAQHEADRERVRAGLKGLNRDQLVKVAHKVGHFPNPRDSARKIVGDLISRADDRRGQAIRRRLIDRPTGGARG